MPIQDLTLIASLARLLHASSVFIMIAFPAVSQEKGQWAWKDTLGKTRTRWDLEQILAEHKKWRNSGGKLVIRPGRIARTLATIGQQADFRDASLSGADLSDRDLSSADLRNADLTNAVLANADLKEAWLAEANLRGAYLVRADLTGAYLFKADLTNANLTDSDLKEAWLAEADLRHAIFEPRSSPEMRGIAAAANLELITYNQNPDALAQLRKQFQDGGFREQERKITYAIKRRQAELLWDGCRSVASFLDCTSYFFSRVLFDLTCQYGMSPGRPLRIALVLWFLCSVLYAACIHTPGEAGLYRVHSQTMEADPSAHRRVVRIQPRAIYERGKWARVLDFFWREWLVFRTAMFFSLMSAFNISFREIDFGRWLRLLTRHEFDMKAIGWTRVVAGWQSLITVYLIALWILTYFGRPFE